MREASKFIKAGHGLLHYLEWGSGSKVLLAFHGYGNSASLFRPFADALGKDYCILSFDLPHHGNSSWPGTAALTLEGLKSLVDEVMKQHSVQQVSLMGYSLGGRICMSFLERFPELVGKVLLLASDGLVVNKYYYFCVRTWLGRRLFVSLTQKPGAYFGLLRVFKKVGAVDEGRHKFITQHFKTDDRRRFLRDVWLCTSELIPDAAHLKSIIQAHSVPLLIVMGKYDKVMPPVLGERFKLGLDTVRLLTLEKGHRVFDETNAAFIAEQFLQ